jgi:hypothetical protein
MVYCNKYRYNILSFYISSLLVNLHGLKFFCLSPLQNWDNSNALTFLFARIRKRAGVTETVVNPLLLRDTCAVRYLQAGGTSEHLCALLGLKSKAALDRYEQLSMQKSQQESQQEPAEEYPFSAMTVSQRSERRRSILVGRRNHHRIGNKKPASGAEEYP